MKLKKTNNLGRTKVNQDLVLANFELLSDLDYYRKAADLEETREVEIDYNRLVLDQQAAIKSLSLIEYDDFDCWYNNIFPEQNCVTGFSNDDFRMADNNENELIYLVSVKGELFLVNNEGYKYCRYTAKLVNYELGQEFSYSEARLMTKGYK